MLKAIVLTVLFVAGQVPVAAADVVTDLGALGMEEGRGAVWIYYRDGQGVTQGRCLTALGIHDRNTCSADARTVEANGFITKLLGFGRTDLEALATAAREQLTRIDRVDLRLGEILNTPSNDAEVQRLEAALAANQEAQAGLETRRAEGDDQVREIRARLSAPSPDPDLARQLAQLEATVLDLRRQIEARTKERNALTVQLIELRSQGSSDTELTELRRWRAELVQEWERAQAAYVKALDEASELRSLVRHLTKSPDLFALEILSTNSVFPGFRPFARKLDTAFERQAKAEHQPFKAYAVVGTGTFAHEDDPARTFEITGWNEHYEAYVSRIPDLKQQCFDSVDRQDLDFSRFIPSPTALPCSYDSRLDYYNCTESREISNPSGNRILQRYVTLTFSLREGDEYLILETWQTCYLGDGRNSVWSEVTHQVRSNY